MQSKGGPVRRFKLSLILIVVCVIVIAGVVGLVGLLTRDTPSAPAGKPAVRVAGPALSPTVVVKDLSKYEDRDLAVKGLINEVQTGQYFIVATEANGGALRLDFSKSSLNPANYANKMAGGQSEQARRVKGPFTVTGKLSKPDHNVGLPVLVVSALE